MAGRSAGRNRPADRRVMFHSSFNPGAELQELVEFFCGTSSSERYFSWVLVSGPNESDSETARQEADVSLALQFGRQVTNSQPV